MMEKEQYITPAVQVHTLEAENMMALSTSRSPAKKEFDVLTNERNDEITDIWDNEF